MAGGYVIELAGGRYFRLRAAGWGWSANPTCALQFARPEDASTLAQRFVPSTDWRIVSAAAAVSSHRRAPYSARPDWPLVATLDQLRDVIFDARQSPVGVRIPVVVPGTSQLAFDPPTVLDCCFSSPESIARRCVAKAIFRRAYFPAGREVIGASEWHVEYSVRFVNVPVSLIPDDFLEDLP